MSHSSSKTSKEDTTQNLNPALDAASNKALQLAGMATALPVANNFGLTTAALTPSQVDAMNNQNTASAAFGLKTANPNAGMPQVQNVNGLRGYSTQDSFNNSMAQLPQAFRDLLASFSYNPNTGAQPTAGLTTGGVSGRPTTQKSSGK